MIFFVYILSCADKTYYIGSTNNIDRRLKEHNRTKKGAHYTKIRRPVNLIYSETYPTLSEARKREHALKKLSRKQKERVMEKHLASST